MKNKKHCSTKNENCTFRMGQSSTRVCKDGIIEILIPLEYVRGPNSPDEVLALLPSAPQYVRPEDPLVHGELWGYTGLYRFYG